MNNTILKNVTIADTAVVRNSMLKDYSRVKDYAELRESELGEYSYISQHSLVNKTIIGKFTSIANGTYIGLWEHNTYVSTHSFYLYETSGGFVKGYKNYDKDVITTVIGNDVWVGANAVILKGVTVRDGAIIGAGSVVTKDVPAYAIAIGNPARVARLRFDEEDINFLLKNTWWNKPREVIQEMVDEGVFYSLNALKEFLYKKNNL